MDEFNGRVAVITGGASGIGLGLARTFGAAGMKLMLGDIEEAALATAAADLGSDGYDVGTFLVDVTSPEAVDEFADATYSRFGACNVLCNNAGVVAYHQAWGGLDDWKWVVNVDFWGVVHGITSFVPRMIEAGAPGHIVNTASTAGLLGFPGISAYVASKHAVVGLSQSMFHELAATELGISVLCPGMVDTKINASERNRPGVDPASVPSAGFEQSAELLTPEHVAGLVLDAIGTGRFWVLPHTHYHDQVTLNVAGMLGDGPPVIPQVS